MDIKEASIISRLKNSIDVRSLKAWLGNFQNDEEKNLAIATLEKFEYFDDNNVIEAYRHCVEKLKDLCVGDVCVHPVGEFAESGTAMTYFFRKAVEGMGLRKVEYLPRPTNFKRLNVNGIYTIIFLDDILGTGKTLKTHYLSFISQQLRRFRVAPRLFVVSVIAHEQAVEVLADKCPEIEILCWQVRGKAFSTSRSKLWSKPELIQIRQLCHRYGVNLFTTYDKATKKESKHPLGYMNSQTLIAFSHTVPNNTLPIFWSSKAGWIPLFPRSTMRRLSDSRKFRNEAAFALSKGKAISDANVQSFYSGHAQYRVRIRGKYSFKKYSYITKTDFLLFSLIRLQRARKSLPIICQILGISPDDIANIVQHGVEVGLMNSDGGLTKNGLSAYNEVLKKSTDNVAGEYVAGVDRGQKTVYVPQTFRGMK